MDPSFFGSLQPCRWALLFEIQASGFLTTRQMEVVLIEKIIAFGTTSASHVRIKVYFAPGEM